MLYDIRGGKKEVIEMKNNLNNLDERVYPIVITPAVEGGYVVDLPDFEVNTEGDSLLSAIYMAKDAMEMMGVYWQDVGRELPQPSKIADMLGSLEGESFVTLVPVNFDAYRKKTERRVVRKSVTIPSWLNAAAEKAEVNFSAVLQKALKDVLEIADPDSAGL